MFEIRAAQASASAGPAPQASSSVCGVPLLCSQPRLLLSPLHHRLQNTRLSICKSAYIVPGICGRGGGMHSATIFCTLRPHTELRIAKSSQDEIAEKYSDSENEERWPSLLVSSGKAPSALQDMSAPSDRGGSLALASAQQVTPQMCPSPESPRPLRLPALCDKLRPQRSSFCSELLRAVAFTRPDAAPVSAICLASKVRQQSVCLSLFFFLGEGGREF